MAWETKRIKDVVKVNELTLSDSTDPNYEFNYIDIGSINQFKITDTETTTFFEAPSRARRIIRKNDILVSTVRTYLKAITYIDFEPKDVIVSTGFAVMTPKKNINPKFLSYTVEADYFIDDVISDSAGTSYPAINASKVEALSVILPPLETQQKIADYLDVKTQNIDKRIELLQKKKEHYTTLRKAIINEAVNGEGKNWKKVRGKDLFAINNGNGFDVRFQGNDNGDYPFCKASDINGNEKYVNSAANFVNEDLVISERYNIIPKDSILFSKIGEALKKNHRKINTVPCIVDNNCAALVSKRKINIEFYYYVFYMINMCKFDNGGTIPSVNSSQLLASSIIYPDINEQQRIVNFLDKKTSAIDSIIEKITTEIDTFKTYRRALINEAVTGKLNIE